MQARSLSDLGRIYCGDGKQVHFFDPFRYVEPLCASNDRKTVLRFPLASLRSPKSDRLLQDYTGGPDTCQRHKFWGRNLIAFCHVDLWLAGNWSIIAGPKRTTGRHDLRSPEILVRAFVSLRFHADQRSRTCAALRQAARQGRDARGANHRDVWRTGLEASPGLCTTTVHTQTTCRHPRDAFHKTYLQRFS